MIHFKPEEFNCRCNYNCGLGFNQMDIHLLDNLDAARTIAAVPFVITSAIRCSQHNSDVGGKENSSHLLGKAIDIVCNNSTDRYIIIKALVKVMLPRIGIGKDFIHIDMDLTKPHPIIFTYY